MTVYTGNFWTRSPGATLDIDSFNSSAVLGNPSHYISGTNNSPINGGFGTLVGGWVTVNGNFFAASSSSTSFSTNGTLSGLTYLAGQSNQAVWATGATTAIAIATASGTSASNAFNLVYDNTTMNITTNSGFANSLKIGASAAAVNLTLTGTGVQTIDAGGILVSSQLAGASSSVVASGAAVLAGPAGGELIIANFNVNGSAFTLGSSATTAIVGGLTQGLTLSGSGTTTVVGATVLTTAGGGNIGTIVELNSSLTSGTTISGNITFAGPTSTLVVNAADSSSPLISSPTITFSPVGGQSSIVITATGTATPTISSNLAMTGALTALTINNGTSGTAGVTLSGNIIFAGVSNAITVTSINTGNTLIATDGNSASGNITFTAPATIVNNANWNGVTTIGNANTPGTIMLGGSLTITQNGFVDSSVPYTLVVNSIINSPLTAGLTNTITINGTNTGGASLQNTTSANAITFFGNGVITNSVTPYNYGQPGATLPGTTVASSVTNLGGITMAAGTLVPVTTLTVTQSAISPLTVSGLITSNVNVNTGALNLANNMTFNGAGVGSISINGGLTVTGNATLAFATTAATNTGMAITLGVAGQATPAVINVNGSTAGNGTTLTLAINTPANNGPPILINSTVSIAAGNNLLVNGAGYLNLATNPSTQILYPNTQTFSFAGIVNLANNAAIIDAQAPAAAAPNTAMVFTSTSTINVTGNASIINSNNANANTALIIAGSVVTTDSSSNLVIGGANASGTILAGVVSGSGGLTMAGTTTLQINAQLDLLSPTNGITRTGQTQQYTGNTTVNSGTLALTYSGSLVTLLNSNSNLVMGGGTLTLTSGASGAFETLNNLNVVNGASTITLSAAGGGTTNFTLAGNTWTPSNGATLLMNIPVNTTITSSPSLTNSGIGGSTINGGGGTIIGGWAAASVSTQDAGATGFATVSTVTSGTITVLGIAAGGSGPTYTVASTNPASLAAVAGTDVIYLVGTAITTGGTVNSLRIGGAAAVALTSTTNNITITSGVDC